MIILFSGPIATGKTAVITNMILNSPESAKIGLVHTSTVIRKLGEMDLNRKGLQDSGGDLDERTGHAWVADAIEDTFKYGWIHMYVDSVRTKKQVEVVRDRFKDHMVVHINLRARPEVLERRYLDRFRRDDDGISYKEATDGESMESFTAFAQIDLDTSDLTIDQVAKRLISDIQYLGEEGD